MPEVTRVIGNAEKMKAETFTSFTSAGLDFPAETPRVQVNDIMTVREVAAHLVDGLDGRARAFVQVGGFPDQPLMEDVEVSRRLKRIGPPLCLRQRVVTSGRRWDQRGPWRTVLLMWRLRLMYWLGMPPERLAKWYR